MLYFKPLFCINYIICYKALDTYCGGRLLNFLRKEGDFPVCYLDDIVSHLRESKALNSAGAISRLRHDYRPLNKLPFKTIFDGPQEINVYPFSKLTVNP